MAQIQTWDNCDYFGNPLICPSMNENDLMRIFAFDTEIPFSNSNVSISYTGIEERGIEINKSFCNKCSEYRPIK